MKLLLKILLGAVGLALVLAIALAVAVAVLLDPKDYQPLLSDSVEQATGRKLTLAGDLGLDFFPCCSITLGRASLGNPPGFPAGDFASVESAALSVKVWPLLVSRQVQIGTVRLQGLNADLLVRADGTANWEFESPAESAPNEPGAASAGSGGLVVEGIKINGGRIAYHDAQDKSAYLAENLELQTGDITPGRPFELRLAARLTDESDGTAGTVTLKGRATLDESLSRLELTAPLLDIAATGGAVPARSMTLTLGSAGMVIETAQDTKVSFTSLEGDFDLKGLEAIAGDASGSFTAGDTRLELGPSVELIIPALSADVTVSGADIPGNAIRSVVKLKGFSLDVDKLWAATESLNADISGLGAQLVLTGSGRLADSGAALAGTLTLEPVSPRSLLAVLKKPDPNTTDPKAMTQLGGTARWALGKDSVSLSALDFRLDNTKVTGTLGLANFDKPATRFDLRLDAIDLDRYREPDAAAPGGVSGSQEKAGTPGDDIPVATLRDLRLDGRLQVGRLKFAGMNMNAVDVNLKAADGRVRLDPLKAKLYGGEYHGAINIDATGKQARLALDQQIAALQVGAALKDFSRTDKLSGALTGQINATGTGNTSDALLKSLGGNVALSLADGAYLGTDLWHEIRTARARLKGDAPPPAPASPKTPLTALKIAGTIANGTLTSDGLLAEIPFIRLTGAGALDLVGKRMDYRLAAQVFEDPTFEDGTRLKDLKGLSIPLTVQGPMDQPKVGVDLKNLAAGVATQKLKDRLFKKFGLDEPAPADGSTPAPADGNAPADKPPADQPQPPPEEKPRDALKRSLRDLLKQ